MLKIVIPEDTEKLKQYITALEYLVEKDTTKKDKQIHQANLENLKEELQKRIRSEAKNIVVDFLKWVLRNLLKDKAPSCNVTRPLNMRQSGQFQNKKLCHYQKELPIYQLPKSQPSPYRFFPRFVF